MVFLENLKTLMCAKTYDLNNEKNKDENIFVKDESEKKRNTEIIYEHQTCKCNILMLFFS